MSYPNEAFNWMRGTDEKSRMDFVREILACCSPGELKIVQKLVNTAQKRSRPIPRLGQKIRRKLLASSSVSSSCVPVSASSVPVSPSCVNVSASSVPVSPSCVPVSASSVPVSPSSAPIVPVASSSLLSSPRKVFWWEVYAESNIIAFDTEMVTLIQPIGNQKNSLGTVALVDYEGGIILSEKIQHAPGSFLTDYAHVAITGFKKFDLENGNNFNEIRDQVVSHFEGSLIITQAGHGDFKAFGLITGDYDTFDIQHKFLQKTGEDNHGYPVMQPIILRRLVLHYFHTDIQDGVHSAEKDAIYTMKLFRIYQNLAKEECMINRSDNCRSSHDFSFSLLLHSQQLYISCIYWR
ncbi:RNA exonuclease 4 [Folsomia candida]|uniref:RNA exonuclease 4 n=1 Tax=Folsomia candida TaxID=158441 RepID=UPI000B90415F|nr:RNA exonuclease 4 [Folsomia candida]